jgi:hypothetical protein
MFIRLAIAFLALCASGLAGEVTVRGSSTGFPMTGSPELSFTGAEFVAATTNGAGVFTGTNSLGTLYLAAGSAVRPQMFQLRLVLDGIAGTPSVTRTLRADIKPAAGGGVFLHFTTPEARVRFDNGTQTGEFVIRVRDLSLRPGQSAPLVGDLAGSEQTDTACRVTFPGARATPAFLLRADQEMVPVTIKPVASDRAGCGLTCKIESVSMNEPPGPFGDYQITGDLSLNVRDERLDGGNGRLYTVAVRCTDNAGNAVTQRAPVVAPR